MSYDILSSHIELIIKKILPVVLNLLRAILQVKYLTAVVMTDMKLNFKKVNHCKLHKILLSFRYLSLHWRKNHPPTTWNPSDITSVHFYNTLLFLLMCIIAAAKSLSSLFNMAAYKRTHKYNRSWSEWAQARVKQDEGPTESQMLISVC